MSFTVNGINYTERHTPLPNVRTWCPEGLDPRGRPINGAILVTVLDCDHEGDLFRGAVATMSDGSQQYWSETDKELTGTDEELAQAAVEKMVSGDSEVLVRVT